MLTCSKYLIDIISKLLQLIFGILPFFRKCSNTLNDELELQRLQKIFRISLTETSSKKPTKRYKKIHYISFSNINIKILFFIVRDFIKTLPQKIYHYSKHLYFYIKKGRYRELTPDFMVRSVRRNLPLFLAVVLITPAVIFLGIFVYSKLNKSSVQAANFTGKVKVSRQSTTLSTAGGWYTALAYSGDGINGDAEAGTFNPIHPGGGTGAELGAGNLAIGHTAFGAMTTFAGSQFIGLQTSANTNMTGVMLVFENLTPTALANVDIMVELLRFPNTTCSTSCTPYPSGSMNAYVYPTGADMVVERRTIWQFNKGLSGENAAPGQFGRATFDFRFDPPILVGQDAAHTHYGIRIINMGTAAPTANAYGVWAQVGQEAYKFPKKKGTLRTIGVDDMDNTSALTVLMPLALTSNSILAGATGAGMVAANSLAGAGLPTARRTENGYWRATYSQSNDNWTVTNTSLAGVQTTQNRKLIMAMNGGTGPSWVDDSAAMTTLTQNSDTSTRLCVASLTGFATNQYIDIWDSDSQPVQRQIGSTSTQAGLCPNDGPSIVTTAANIAGFTVGVPSGVNKNATVARSVWKQRIIQGAVQLLQKDADATAVVCVSDNSKFTDTGTVAIWDDDSVIATRTISSHAGSCSPGQPLTLSSSPTAIYTTGQNAYLAEVSATLSNTGIPADGAVIRWNSFNHTQNPTDSTLLTRTSTVAIAYAKSTAPSLSATRYPFLSNRHLFFVAYGTGDTSAPADGDIVIIGNGKSDPDSYDSSTLTDDKNWSSYSGHEVKIDRNWDAALAYTGFFGGAVGNGAGVGLSNYSAYSQNAGWVSALVLPGAQLGIDNSANKHYRLNIPGKIVVDSDASVAFGKTGSAIPATSLVDVYFDNVSPEVSTLVRVNTTVSTTLEVVDTTGFQVGDYIIIDDNDSPAIVRQVAAIEDSDTLTLLSNATVDYTIGAQAAYVAKGRTTELPTGQDRRAGIYTMTGLNNAATPVQSNIRTGRVSLYAKGSNDFRTEKSNLAVDIDGNIDTGYLGNNMTDSGNTWVDVKDDVVGDWQPLDPVAVAGATNLVVDNNYSSPGLGGTDDANLLPLWTGGVGTGGKTDLPTPNMEVAEIGTIPMTDIYNADYNGGSGITYSSNYNNSSAWTLFDSNTGDIETNDMVYFGDQGNNMLYALEFNLGSLLDASANYVWEYYQSGVGWTPFTPRDAYKYQPRLGYSIPLSADTVKNSLTLTALTSPTGTGNIPIDSVVKIDDNDSDPIYRRTTTNTSPTVTLTEPVPANFTTGQGATVSRLNGGQWMSIDPTTIFTGSSGASRRIISWTPDDLAGTAEKIEINGKTAYWVRAKLTSVSSWTTSPANQTTPVCMSGLEKISSGVMNISSGVQEAKITEVTPAVNFNPNEQWLLDYGSSPGWTQILPIVPSAPFAWHIKNGILSQNTATTDFHISNGDFSWGDYTVTAKVRMRTVPDTTTRRIGIVLRDSIDGNGYGAIIERDTDASPQYKVGLYPMALGAEGTGFTNSASKEFLNDTWYNLEASVAGTGASTSLSVRFWADGSGRPANSDVSYTTTTAQGLWGTGRIGLFADNMIADFDDVTVSGGATFSDSFTDTGTWNVFGSINGLIGAATPGAPFTTGNFINFSLKHKGGWDGVVTPEIGDKIYLSPTSTRSYKGLSGIGTTAVTTSNANTKYENIDFEWNPASSNYTVTGSATGAMGTATPGTAYLATGGKLGLTIPSGTPTGTMFGSTRMLLLQDNYRRNNGSWIGNNGLGSAVLVYPSYGLANSPIAITRYSIEGINGTATARQNGTIDFWFKTNYSGAPSATFSPKGMYLFDYANQLNTDRLFIRHNPDGNLEAAVFQSTAQNIILKQSFTAVAGAWHHFRLTWIDSSARRAWLDGAPFSIGTGSTMGDRGANAGLIRIGNDWTYDAPFDGAIDEFGIFDNAIDSSSACDWGSFSDSLPSGTWVSQQVVGCDDADSDQGTNIFLSHFDKAMNPKEGFIWADYAYGNPAMIFTNGADTGNERIRVVTYPERTRVWVDNTGEKHSPSARIKFGASFQESTAIGSVLGWSHNFTYHHKAKRDSTTNPTFSPVLNLRRNIWFSGEENIAYAGAAAPSVPINAALGFGQPTVGLSGLATINMSNISMDNMYSNFAILTNPYTSLVAKPTQQITDSVFFNSYERAYTIANKTQGTNYVGANFVSLYHAAAGNDSYAGQGYNAAASINVGLSGSIFMGCRNANTRATATTATGAASFLSSRLYNIRNSEFYNNGITGSATTAALSFASGVAKVGISDNIFSINNYGIRLLGNSFITMENNIFDGHTSDVTTTVAGEYGAGIRIFPTTSSVAITDNNSIFGRGLWNEADINTPPNTTTFEAESLIQFVGSGTQFLSPVLFGTVDYNNMQRIPEHYFIKTVPGSDVRGTYSSNTKDIVNFTTFGNMRTSGSGLSDTTVKKSGGYAWTLEPNSTDVSLDYTAKLVGVADKPLAATGYIQVNSAYGSTNLPTVTLSGLGMTGANLTWTAADSPGVWQQFVVSGTPTESALAELKISAKNNFVVSDSGTNEIIANPIGNHLPPLLEDVDKSWISDQWVGYKLLDSNGKIFDIVRNTDKILYLKGVIVPFLLSTTLTTTTVGDYIIFQTPRVYIDEVSVLSGEVDTGTLDYYSSGQPVSPWLSTGLTAEGVWNAQWSIFANSDGSFGQLLTDSLIAQYADVYGGTPTTTVFNTNLESNVDDFYLNGVIVFTEGQNKGAVRRISDYGSASKTITVDPALPYAPADGDRFAVLAATASSGGGSGGSTAQEIWTYTLRTLTDASLNSGSLATAADVSNIRADITSVLTELGTGNISAIRTATNSINWSNVTGLVTTAGLIKDKTDNIDWNDIATIQTNTGDIDWEDITAIKLKTNTIDWGDITTIKSNVATLMLEIGTSNISAIKTATDTINWSNVTGLVTTAGLIKAKTDNIDWNDITAIQAKTDLIDWDDVTGIQLKTDTIAWGDIATLQSSINGLNNISAADVWAVADKTITGVTTAGAKNIWDSACAILTSSGSVGKLVCDNLDAKVSEAGGSTLTAEEVWNYATRSITGLSDPALAAIANSVWDNETKTLTSYGNDITAQQVWDALTNSLTMVDSIGKLLVTNVDETISSRASQASVDAMAGDLAIVLSEIGTGNISAIKTKTNTINWDSITGLVSTSGEIKAKTDNINWSDIGAIKTATDTIDWDDITAIKLKTNTIDWGDITDIKSNVAILMLEIGTSNISAIKTATDTINWSNVTGLVTISGQIKAKTDAIDWDNVTGIKTKTDLIDWDDVTGIILKTDTIDWTDIDTISSRVDTTVSSRASQSSLDSHESADAAFRPSTTNTLGALTVNVATVLGQLSTIETKIDSVNSALLAIDDKIDIVDTNLDSIKTTVEDTNAKVTAMQTVTNSILNKWSTYDAATIIGYVDTLESNIGDPEDATASATVFGKLNYIKNNSGSGGTIDLIYSQAQSTHNKLLEVQTDLGFSGKTTSAYDEIVAIKGYVDSIESSLATLDTRTSSIATSVTNISADLKTVTDRIGKVSVDSFTQLFEVKATDTVYLKNKVIELKAMADIDRQLLEKVANQPIVKVVMEWGSVVIKFVIVNPSGSTTQKIPFKAFLPKEVRQEYIMDQGGLALNYDATTEQYYVTADITLEKGESVIRNVEIKDIWIISDDEVASLRKQSDEIAQGLKNTSYNAQAITLKTDINTRLDKVARKQKDNNATPQDHILAYRENMEDMKAINENIKGLKDLVINSGAGSNFLASVGGIQVFSTWGIVLVLIFCMGVLGMFYYQLWKRKVITETIGKGNKTKTIELPTPSPLSLPGLDFVWLKNIFLGWIALLKDLFSMLTRLANVVKPRFDSNIDKFESRTNKTLIVLLVIILTAVIIAGGLTTANNAQRKNQEQVMGTSNSVLIPIPTPISNREEKIKGLVAEMVQEAVEKKKTNAKIEELMKNVEQEASVLASSEVISESEKIPTKTQGQDLTTNEEEKSKILGVLPQNQQLIVVKQTPTDWLNVREKPSLSAEIVTKIYPGESYPFSEVQSGWYKILLKDFKEGWVSAQYVKLEREMKDRAVEFVNIVPPEGSGVNIREKPNEDSKTIKTIYITNKYPKLGEVNGWIKIELLDGDIGWVYKDFIQKSDE